MALETLTSLERQQQILILLKNHHRISVQEICQIFTISEATARRDLELLTDQKLIRRVHGGAISLTQAPPEPPIIKRESRQIKEKKLIGRAAATLIGDGDIIFLGSGTTVLEVAKEIKDHTDLTIVTNSLPILNYFSGNKNASIIALGGIFRDSELSFIGHIAEQTLSEINANKVIIGIRAIHIENGLTNDYLPETMTDRAILKAGKEVIVVADYTKLNIISTAFLAPVTAINTLVTDKNAPEDFIDQIKSKGVDVITAE